MKVGDYVKNVNTGQVLAISKIEDWPLVGFSYTLSNGAVYASKGFERDWRHVVLMVHDDDQPLEIGDYVFNIYTRRVTNIKWIKKQLVWVSWPFANKYDTTYILSGAFEPSEWTEEEFRRSWKKAIIKEEEQIPVTFNGTGQVIGHVDKITTNDAGVFATMKLSSGTFDWAREDFSKEQKKEPEKMWPWFITICNPEEPWKLLTVKYRVLAENFDRAREEAKKLKKVICKEYGVKPSDYAWAIYTREDNDRIVLASKNWK